MQGRQTQPRDVYDIVSDVINDILAGYKNPRRDPAQEELTTTGGRQNDRQSKSSKKRI